MASFKRQRLSNEDEITGTEEYEVFLSFRGPDTRQGFADVLYDCMDRAGIRVFRDDDELAIGDRIDKILLALNNSQICVPIFSKTFAESKWCLTEVTKMVDLNKDVVPIFYDVTPDDVDLKTPAYREFMAKHENRYDKNRVEKWEAALKDVKKLKGREVLNTRYTTFCKTFVEELLIKLKPRKRYDLDNLVGMDNQVDSAMKLLDIEAAGLRYILIHGMGGIGKTTLSKVIFDKVSASFDRCSFMENLRESSKREGLDNLQKKLADSLDPKPAASSNICRDIRERFRGKKVLIILDDVDAGEQVDELVGKSSFASGSRIVITTRNANVLNECEDLDEDSSFQSLEMATLQYNEALELFKVYAFRKESPPPIYENLCKEAISTAGGLPLAVKVIASLLRGKSEGAWRDVIARSKKIPPKEVKDRLKISYDELEDEQKQIFLDIACFFTHGGISYANYMWEACDLHPTYGLEVLMSMSLVKMTDENAIWMHDQLRDMGRDIVREENISDPTKRSRIWLPEDAVKVLEGKEGKRKVEALSLRQPLKMSLTREQCAGFRNLRFLELEQVHLEGDYEGLWTELKWLSWFGCPSEFKVSHSFSKNLVVLNLSNSWIDEIWGGWSPLFQMAVNLKVLDLNNCENLTHTPDFSRNLSLERLIISGCRKLVEIGSSIGNLRRLKFLNLRNCDSLRGLPEEIGSLEGLEEMHVSGRSQPFSLPNSIGNLKSLLTLKLKFLTVDNIPASIGELVRLNHLVISKFSESSKGSKEKEMPESLGNLKSLVELDLSNQGGKLPASIGGLLQLKALTLCGCKGIKEVSDSLRYLKSLVRLDLSYTGISNLPDSFGDLEELRVLHLYKCREITKLPESIGRLNELVELDARGCKSLEEIPPEIGGLSSLRKLVLSGSSIRSLPSTADQLSLLEELELGGCRQLQQLPELPLSLRKLVLSRSGIRSLPSTINQLVILEELDLEGCRQLQQLPELPPSLRKLVLLRSRIRSLPSTADQLVLLEELDLEGCRKLQQLPELPSSLRKLVLSRSGIRSLPSTINRLVILKELDLEGCRQLQQLPELPLSLRKLVLSGSSISSLPSTINQLVLLKELYLKGCRQLQQLPELPPSLRKLVLSGSSISSLPSAVDLLSLLEELDLGGCDQLQQLPELPPSLTTLSFSTGSWLQKVHDLPTTELHPNSLDTLQKLANLKKLEWGFSKYATTKLLFLSSLTQLESLVLTFQPPPSVPSTLRQLSRDAVKVELPRLSNLMNLSSVSFRNLLMEDGGLVNNLGVEELERLKDVEIDNCSDKLVEAMCLAESLSSLWIRSCRSLPDLSHLRALTVLGVQRCREITQIYGLEELESLSCLIITGCLSLVRLGNLSKLKLSFLWLCECPALTCIEGIDSPTDEGLSIISLTINRCDSLQNVDALLRRCRYGDHDGRRYKNDIKRS